MPFYVKKAIPGILKSHCTRRRKNHDNAKNTQYRKQKYKNIIWALFLHKANTASLKTRPLSSKFENISKLAQAGESKT